MRSRMDPTLSPPWYEIEPLPFQRFCRELFSKEPNISTVEQYGTPGQGQRGIDLMANRSDGVSIEVGQCKRYRKFTSADIRKASTDFLGHWDHWKSENIHRFVLFVACDLDDTQVIDRIQREKATFLGYGIIYEAWGAATISLKAEPHRNIVRKYTQSEEWVQKICGPASDVAFLTRTSARLDLVIDAAGERIERLSSKVSETTAQQLEGIRELYRRGQAKTAYSELRALRKDRTWPDLDRALQARILRTLAAYVLSITDDVKTAERLANEASKADPDANDSIIRALIEYQNKGPEAALCRIDKNSDSDAFNLNIALLTELGRYDEILAELESKPNHIVPNADTKSFHAQALLANHNLDGAQSHVQQALSEHPEWVNVKIAAALVNYFSALLPGAIPSRVIAWPELIDWSYIKQDEDSLNRLRRAEALFDDLARTTQRSADERHFFRVWRLSCLANDPTRQSEARELCHEILRERPDDPKSVVFGIARNYEIDLQKSQRALEQVSKGAEGYVEAANALALIYLNGGRIKRVLDLLRTSSKQFYKRGAEDLWRLWHVQALVLDGRAKKALRDSESAKHPVVRTQLRSIALRGIARQSGDWNPLVAHLEQAFNETNNEHYLHECCEIKLNIGEYAYVADRAEAVTELLKTPAGLYIALKGAWGAKRPELCLKLLNDHVGLFPGRTLPADFRRLRVYCQERLGLITEALAEAELLAQESSRVEDRLMLMDMQLRKGDLKALAVTARPLVNGLEAKPSELLQVARFVSLEDSDLAQRLWAKAKGAAGSDPKLLSEAIKLGFALGRDNELDPLMANLQELASKGQGPGRAIELKDVIAESRRRAESQDFAVGLYNKGELPVHVLAEFLNVTLARIYHHVPETNQEKPDPINQAVVLAHHGGRVLQESLCERNSNWRMHLDVTALLLAAHLDILDVVEQCFKPLYISSAVQLALVRQTEMLRAQQPRQLEGHRQILHLLDSSKIQATQDILPEVIEPSEFGQRMGDQWMRLFNRAVNEGAYVVEYLPLRSKDDERLLIQVPESGSKYVVNCRSLIDALRQAEKITADKFEKVINGLGSENVTVVDSLPPINSTLYLAGSTVSVLANADVLDIVARHFRVVVDAGFVDFVRRKLEDDQERYDLSVWIGRLLNRLREGLDNGTYMPIRREESSSEAVAEESDEKNQDFLTVLDLFRFTIQEGDVVWSDDRLYNSYARRDLAPIISILEVLFALRLRRAITEGEYYEKLGELRAANIRYVPAESEEIIYYLDQARILDGAIVETDQLASLRRYIAACLLDTERLQKPPMPVGSSNPYGEIAFAVNTVQAVREAMVAGWTNETITDEVAVARADWILGNLYTGHFGIRHLQNDPNPDSARVEAIGLDLAAALSAGIGLRGKLGNKNSSTPTPRERYFRWLRIRMTDQRFSVDPSALDTCARTLMGILRNVAKIDSEDEEVNKLSHLTLQEFYLDMPEELQAKMELPSELLHEIGVQLTDSIQLGQHVFHLADFLAAASRAVNEEPVQLEALEPKAMVVIKRVPTDDAGRIVIRIADEDETIKYELDDPSTGMLLNDANDREKVLVTNRALLDCDDDDHRSLANQIIGLDDPFERVKRLRAWLGQSAAAYYSRLERKLIESGAFAFDELMPSTGVGLLRYYRLQSYPKGETSFATRLREGAAAVLATETLSETLTRYANLPIDLPQVLREAFDALTVAQKEMLLGQLTVRWMSPVSRLHLLDLAFSCAQDGQFATDLASRIANELFSESEGVEHFSLFKSFLNWVGDELSYEEWAQDWDAPLRLAMTWAHASRLHNIFCAAGVSPSKLAELIEAGPSKMSAEVFSRDLNLWYDILHPSRLHRAAFLVRGISSILAIHGIETLAALGWERDFLKTAFERLSPESLPTISLLKDPAVACNGVGSFLGSNYDNYLTTFFDAETSRLLSSEGLKSVVKEAIDSLAENPESFQDWAKILAIVGDEPLYEEMKVAFRDIVEKTDFAKLAKDSLAEGLVALRTAAYQNLHGPDQDLRKRLEEELIRIARNVASERAQGTEAENEATERIAAGAIMEVIITLAVIPAAPRETSREFSRLLKRATDTWPSLIDMFGAAIDTFAQGLPASHLHGMWPLLLEYRAKHECR